MVRSVLEHTHQKLYATAAVKQRHQVLCAADLQADARVLPLQEGLDQTRWLVLHKHSSVLSLYNVRSVGSQTELPTTTAGTYHVLTAVRGEGARIARHHVATQALVTTMATVTTSETTQATTKATTKAT